MTRPVGSRATPARALLLALGGWLAFFAPVSAQLSAGFSAASFQFNLSNPGARSLGMGGAFTGLANDATAAYANPAGLTILGRPEVSFEGRTAKLRLPLVAAEPIVNGASLSSQDLSGDTRFESLVLRGVAELTPLGAPDASGTTASFVSFVYPVKRWTFALYRHQLADLEASGGVALAPISTSARLGALENRTTTSGTSRNEARIDIRGFGFAAARPLGERLAVGVTLVRNEAAIGAARDSRFRTVFEGTPSGETSVAFENRMLADDSDLTVNAGLLVRPARDWAIGISFREGARFELAGTDTTTISDQAPVVRTSGAEFRVPDVLSLGASYRAARRIVVSAEWDRVGYSKLGRPSTLPDSLERIGDPVDPGRLGRFAVDDADELHAGVEMTFWSSRLTPSVRVGAWHDPEHKVRFEPSAACPGEGDRSPSSALCSLEETNPDGPLGSERIRNLYGAVADAMAAESLRLLFPAGADELHLTAGLGLVLGSRLQLDAAVDYVDRDRYVASLSGIVQF